MLAKQLYSEILDFLKNCKQLLQINTEIDISKIIPISEKVIDFMMQSNDLNYYAINYYDEHDVFISHSANVAIFAVTIGIGMKYQQKELVNLCSAGIIHDLGIARVPAKASEKTLDKLSKQNNYFFKKHVTLGYDSVIKVNEQIERIAQIASLHHEKYDGSGFPNGLKSDKIDPLGQILSVADAYESLIHPRKQRDGRIPPLGIKHILQNRGNFYSKEILKALLDHISIYPVGVYVKLNSNEIGRVVGLNPDKPLQPIIKILYDSKGVKVKPFEINLGEEIQKKIKTCIPLKNK